MREAEHTVLHIVTRGFWGGAATYVHTLATHLPHEFTSHVAVGEGDALPEVLAADGVSVHRLKSAERSVGIGKELALWKEIYGLIATVQPAIVHLNSSKIGSVGACAATAYNILHTKDKRVRIIFTSHGWAFREERPRIVQYLLFVAQWITALLSHRVICVSENVKQHARSMYGAQEKLITIYNGIHAPDLLPREEARSRCAPDVTASTWIGTIAELVPNKGLDILIQAFSRVAQDFPDTHLCIIGSGDQRLELEQRITDTQNASHITLCGHIYNAARLLNAFDIFTLTSRKEGFPYALLEAGHASLPVVATRVGGIPEIIENTTSGILVRPNNIKETEVALRRLLEHADMRAHLGNALHAKVTTTFSQEGMVEKTATLYHDLLKSE